MTKFGDIPSSVCRQIAIDAVDICTRYMKRRGWKAFSQLVPLWGKNKVGISVGSAKYLNYQNKGTHPFIPWGIQNKTVPFETKPDLFNPSGLVFRSARGVGIPGFVHIPTSYLNNPKRQARSKQHTPTGSGNFEKGGYDKLIWREAKWANPGIKPTYFINKALREAVETNLPKIKKYRPNFRLKHNVRDDCLSLEQ